MNGKSSPGRILLAVFILTFLAGVIVTFSACGESEPPPDLTVWSGWPNTELSIVREAAERFGKENGVTVSVISVPFSELRIKYQIAAPAGQGPDLMTGPHDWAGTLVTADLIAPLSEEEFNQEQQSNYNPLGIQGMTYEGKLYGVPISLETIAIIANKAHMTKQPETFDELIQQAVEFQNANPKNKGFFFQANEIYYSWPILAGFGAEIFGETNGKIDSNKILLNSPETIQGLNYLADLKRKYDLIPSGATTDMMAGIFSNGNMLYCLNGPWALGDLKKQGIDYEVFPMPPLPNGQRPKPFVGIQGFYLNKLTPKRALAIKFMHYVNTAENQKKLSLASGRIPSRIDTLDQIQDQKGMLAFAEAIQYGAPMPNSPAFILVTATMNETLPLVIEKGENPETLLPLKARQIQNNIRTMME